MSIVALSTRRRVTIAMAMVTLVLFGLIALGVAAGVTGPLSRGDRATVDAHLASLDDPDARSLYADQDVFAHRKVEHFAGLGAEWWFNSSSYP